MPLERRVQPPRSYQRQRRQPYNLTRCLRDSRTGEELQSRLPNENAQSQVPFKIATKRTGYGKCTCMSRDEPMLTDASHSDTFSEDEAEEAQRLSPDQRAQTNGNRRSWRTEERISLAFCRVPRSHNSFLPSVREFSSNSPMNVSDSTNSVNRVSPMTPNAVPMPTSSSSSPSYSPVPVPHGEFFNFCASNSSRVRDVNNVGEITNQCRTFASDIRDDCLKSLAASLCRSRGPLLGTSPAVATPHSRLVANRVIRHARVNKTPDERYLWCPDCHRLPVMPVTGQCGHTRCTKCIQDHGNCPCGMQAPKNLYVNTLIQDLIRKMINAGTTLRSNGVTADSAAEQRRTARKPVRISLPVSSRSSSRIMGRSQSERAGARLRLGARPTAPELPPEPLMSPQARFELAWRLLSCGQLLEAAPHFARVAASSHVFAKASRAQLAQIITVLSRGRDPRRLTRELYRSVRAQAAAGWLRPADLECVLCYHTYTSPVATPCGHTYCRTCIERSMDYKKSCALCLRSLDDFNLAATKDTEFVCAALASIDALSPPTPLDPDVIPIFVCTVAYPAIPCPLFIFDPRYWLMIRRVLESGSRKFGMVAYERDRSYSDYGTVLEVCDCVHLEDGRSILSTVGVSRFRVIRRDVRDGCDVARIQPLTDIAPTEELAIWELRLMAAQISYKALLWLNRTNQTVRAEIKAAFGWWPEFDPHQEWWDSPDGPAWLWWLIAILPLRSEIKILILSTKNLLKRMMAVSRTLEAIDQAAISTTTSECELDNTLTTDVWI